jgi:hypothetical protein
MKLIMLSVLLMPLIAATAAGQESIVEFDVEAWDLSDGQVVEHLGRQSIIGTAVLKDVEFEDGVIEFDVAATEGRSYPGIFFRMQSSENYERFYLRPHRTGLYDDALQYTPTFGGISGWQLYSGSGYTAATEFDKGRWVNVRVEVKGDQARVFVDGHSKPALEIDQLAFGSSKGGIALNTLRSGNAFISNFRYREDNSLVFDHVPDPGTRPGVVTDWQVSQVLELDFTRHVRRNRGQMDCIFARANIHADEGRTKKYAFGYSDIISVFLNGDPVFQGSAAYTQRDSSFLGILGTYDNIYLNLKKGDNELLVLVKEVFGGWGVMFQDTTATFTHEGIEEIWRTADIFRTPETVLFDPQKDVLYVTNFDVYNRSRGQGNQSISRVSLDGNVLDVEWAKGLYNPTGMALHRGRLFVVERTSVVEIDTGSGKVIKRATLPASRFLNDIAIDHEGIVYVSDTTRGVIYRSSGEEYEEWLKDDELEGPNGLHIADGEMLVGDGGDGRLKSVDLSSGEVRTVVKLWPGRIDGIEQDAAGNYLVRPGLQTAGARADRHVYRQLRIPTGQKVTRDSHLHERLPHGTDASQIVNAQGVGIHECSYRASRVGL